MNLIENHESKRAQGFENADITYESKREAEAPPKVLKMSHSRNGAPGTI